MSSRMRALPKVHIVSAGIGGLTLARCLRKKRIKAIIFEKNASPARHNYGISLQPQAYRAYLNLVQLDESTFCQKVVVDATR
jgi:2-polyprenyl-6-methoxyphenol hydroxylase-like FAD-dependent oxidoreductase